jgi:hypothetical protein
MVSSVTITGANDSIKGLAVASPQSPTKRSFDQLNQTLDCCLSFIRSARLEVASGVRYELKVLVGTMPANRAVLFARYVAESEPARSGLRSFASCQNCPLTRLILRELSGPKCLQNSILT